MSIFSFQQLANGAMDGKLLQWGDDPYRIWNQATKLAKSQRYREASAHLEEVIRLKPVDVHQAWKDLGLVQEGLRQYESAIKSFDEAIAIKPNFTEAIVARGRSP